MPTESDFYEFTLGRGKDIKKQTNSRSSLCSATVLLWPLCLWNWATAKTQWWGNPPIFKLLTFRKSYIRVRVAGFSRWDVFSCLHLQTIPVFTDKKAAIYSITYIKLKESEIEREKCSGCVYYPERRGNRLWILTCCGTLNVTSHWDEHRKCNNISVQKK